MKKKFEVLYIIGSFIVSFGLGVLLRDEYLLTSIGLFFASIQTLLQTKGKWYQEIIGIVDTVLTTVICVLAGMYGSGIFTVIVILPSMIFTLINWKKNEKDDVVQLNKMTLSKSIITLLIVVGATFLVSYLLSLIPGQNLAFLDSLSNILNVCGILLIALLYKEGWIVWMVCNIVDIVTWVIVYYQGYSNNAPMMIIMSIFFFAMNVWGFVAFIRMRKEQEKESSINVENILKIINKKV